MGSDASAVLVGSDASAVLVGLVGEGIQRSHSPVLHQREADRQGVRLIYTVIDAVEHRLTAGDLPELLRWARRLGYRGLNVTHPFKQEIVPHLDELSDEARVLGAVNTLVFEDGRTRGYNTDTSGFERSFARGFPTVPRQRVVQLGAGGAGAAVAHALLRLGVGHLTLVDLAETRATGLAAALAGEFGADRVTAGASGAVSDALTGADGLVNATPIGMAHHPGCPVQPFDLRRDLWVADIVYRPADTPLLQAARSVGAPTLPGDGMSVYQAVAAYEHFTGRTPDAEAMLADSAELLRSGF
nr:shikimate dehydrogenase [Micromonospora sp. DSM 115978]